MGLNQLLTNLEAGDVGTALDNYPNHNNTTTYNYGNSYTPVFEGVFRQKSYKFGEGSAYDRPGGSYSRQPYLYVKDTQEGLLGTLSSGIEGISDAIGGVGDQLSDAGVDSYTDGFIRGGLGTVLKRSADDMLRIGKWMVDGPKGPMWILKQMGLQRSNPKLQEFPEGETAVGKFLGAVEGFLGRNRVYNLGVNTFAQPLVNAFGLHINRAGTLPFGRPNYGWETGYGVDSGNKSKYEYNARAYADSGEMIEKKRKRRVINLDWLDSSGGGSGGAYGLGPVNNRNPIFKGKRKKKDKPREIVLQKAKTRYKLDYKGNRLIQLLDHIYDTGGSDELYSYSGGAHSLYGIGRTRIKKYYSSMGARYRPLPYKNKHYNGGNPMHTGKIQGPKPNSILNLQDYKTGNKLPSREKNYSLGNPGSLNKTHTIDAVNALQIIRSKNEVPKEFIDPSSGKKIKDFIPFRFEAVNSDDPTQSDTIIFRAHLDSYSDSFSGKWNKFNYNGRAEQFYTYDNFDRKIAFKFKIGAQSKEEMRPLYTKLNYLISNTAPEYANNRMRGSFIRLTMGDLVHRTPGILTRMQISWKSNWPWEIQDTGGMYQLPQILNVSCNFIPIHNFIPQKSITKSPFILPHRFNGAVKHEWLPTEDEYFGDKLHPKHSPFLQDWDTEIATTEDMEPKETVTNEPVVVNDDLLNEHGSGDVGMQDITVDDHGHHYMREDANGDGEIEYYWKRDGQGEWEANTTEKGMEAIEGKFGGPYYGSDGSNFGPDANL